LTKLIEQGRFREDLYYRFNEIAIEIPPLREREGDVSLIARTLLNKYNQEYGRRLSGFTKEAIDAMETYGWPGNVRELENKLKRAVIMEEGDRITANSLQLQSGEASEETDCDLHRAREKLEIQIAQRALSLHAGNVSKAADAMGVSRPTLYSIMEKHKIKP
jgi:two-component system NtrC family response regulator